MKVLFLHGYGSRPGGLKPTYLKDAGFEVLNPSLPSEDFEESVRIAQKAFDESAPDVVVGSSMGGAVAMNIDSAQVPLVLLCPAWKRWGCVCSVKKATRVLHSPQDDLIPIADSEELLENSGLSEDRLLLTGHEHRLADGASLQLMAGEIGRAVRKQVPRKSAKDCGK